MTFKRRHDKRRNRPTQDNQIDKIARKDHLDTLFKDKTTMIVGAVQSGVRLCITLDRNLTHNITVASCGKFTTRGYGHFCAKSNGRDNPSNVVSWSL